MKLLCRIETQANRILWGESLAGVKPWRRRLVNTARNVYAIGRDLSEGQRTLRAMSLVHTTLLSLLPLIALSFSVFKGFGVQNQMRPVLLALLEPLVEKGFVNAEQVIDFVNNIRVGVLGALGLGLLIHTVVTLLQKTELAFT